MIWRTPNAVGKLTQDFESRPNHVFRVASGTKVFTGDN